MPPDTRRGPANATPGPDQNTRSRHGEGTTRVAPFAERLAQAQAILETLPEQTAPNQTALDAYRLVKQTGAVLTSIRPDRPFRPVPRHGDGLQQDTYALAGLLASEPCEHVKAKTATGPVTVRLTYRRADCSDCASRWAENGPPVGLWVPPAPAVAEDRCDLCDELAPDDLFTPVMCSLGIFVIGGDVCRDCAEIIVGPKDCCDVVIGGVTRLRPYEGGGYEIVGERVGFSHDDDCDWYRQHEAYSTRAQNRAQRRAAVKRARKQRQRA
jgi:hypothetical protein